jgi:hypothetical protein
MNANNMPGFTAEASLYRKSGRYQSVATHAYSGGEQSVISQMRGGGGISIGGGRMGFWGCLACVALCSIIIGDPHACLDACVNSGACEETA